MCRALALAWEGFTETAAHFLGSAVPPVSALPQLVLAAPPQLAHRRPILHTCLRGIATGHSTDEAHRALAALTQGGSIVGRLIQSRRLGQRCREEGCRSWVGAWYHGPLN